MCASLARLTIRITIGGMKKFLLLILLVTASLMASGCKSHSGSREFIPGKGWVPN